MLLPSFSLKRRRALEIIAHRGLHRIKEEENTLRAFGQAIVAGCSMLELDVRKTKDGQLIVIHGPSFYYRGHEVVIGRQNLEYLIDSDLVVDRCILRDEGGFKIPTIQLVLRLFLQRIRINIELKDPLSGLLLGMILGRLVDNLKLDPASFNQIVVSSFIAREIESFRGLYNEIPAGILVNTLGHSRASRWRLARWMQQFKVGAVHFSCQTATKETIAYFKDKGFAVRVYTVNDLNELFFYQGCGVDGIFTDKPSEFLRAIHSQALRSDTATAF